MKPENLCQYFWRVYQFLQEKLYCCDLTKNLSIPRYLCFKAMTKISLLTWYIMVAFQRKIVKMMKISTWNQRILVTITFNFGSGSSSYNNIGKSCTVVIWRIYWCWLCQVICTRDIVIVTWQRANLLKVHFCQKILMFLVISPNRRPFYFPELENLNFSLSVRNRKLCKKDLALKTQFLI